MSALAELNRALAQGLPATEEAFSGVFGELAAGSTTPAELGSMLGALAVRADPEDAVAFILACRAEQPLIRLGRAAPVLNIVGTGGGKSTFNVSTATAFTLAAAGVKVVKTGSGAYSSRSGFAETATVLGVLRDLAPTELGEVLDEVGIVLVSPVRCAPSLGRLADAVKPASFRAIGGWVNAIGPLLSPMAVDHRIFGASTERLERLLTDAARRLGDLPAVIVHGEEGVDEAATIGRTRVTTVARDGAVCEVLEPERFDFGPTSWEMLAGRDPRGSARLLTELLHGRGTTAQTELVAFNAAVASWASGRIADPKTAFDEARSLLASGAPGAVLERLRRTLARR